MIHAVNYDFHLMNAVLLLIFTMGLHFVSALRCTQDYTAYRLSLFFFKQVISFHFFS